MSALGEVKLWKTVWALWRFTRVAGESGGRRWLVEHRVPDEDGGEHWFELGRWVTWDGAVGGVIKQEERWAERQREGAHSLEWWVEETKRVVAEREASKVVEVADGEVFGGAAWEERAEERGERTVKRWWWLVEYAGGVKQVEWMSEREADVKSRAVGKAVERVRVVERTWPVEASEVEVRGEVEDFEWASDAWERDQER